MMNFTGTPLKPISGLSSPSLYVLLLGLGCVAALFMLCKLSR